MRIVFNVNNIHSIYPVETQTTSFVAENQLVVCDLEALYSGQVGEMSQTYSFSPGVKNVVYDQDNETTSIGKSTGSATELEGAEVVEGIILVSTLTILENLAENLDEVDILRDKTLLRSMVVSNKGKLLSFVCQSMNDTVKTLGHFENGTLVGLTISG